MFYLSTPGHQQALAPSTALVLSMQYAAPEMLPAYQPWMAGADITSSEIFVLLSTDCSHQGFTGFPSLLFPDSESLFPKEYEVDVFHTTCRLPAAVQRNLPVAQFLSDAVPHLELCTGPDETRPLLHLRTGSHRRHMRWQGMPRS